MSGQEYKLTFSLSSCQGIKSEESKHVTRLKELGCAFISLLEILKERMEFMTGSLQTSFS